MYVLDGNRIVPIGPHQRASFASDFGTTKAAADGAVDGETLFTLKMRNLELCRFEIHESELRFKMKLLKKP